MTLRAHLEHAEQRSDRRLAARRRLSLGSSFGESGAEVWIYDLSSTGLLIETLAALSTDETVEVDIPEIGVSQATVVWSSGRFFGCQFSAPIPSAAISTALLRSEIAPGRAQPSHAGSREKHTAESPARQSPAAQSRFTAARLWIVAALSFGALTYLILTGHVVTIIVIASIVGLIIALLVAMLIRVENYVGH